MQFRLADCQRHLPHVTESRLRIRKRVTRLQPRHPSDSRNALLEMPWCDANVLGNHVRFDQEHLAGRPRRVEQVRLFRVHQKPARSSVACDPRIQMFGCLHPHHHRCLALLLKRSVSSNSGFETELGLNSTGHSPLHKSQLCPKASSSRIRSMLLCGTS